MDTAKIMETMEQDFDSHLGRIRKYLSQPSVSNTGEGMREMVALLVDELKDLGCQTIRIVETPNWPVVYAHLDVGAPKTLLLYGMYDVQPIEKEGWTVPPFGGTIVEHPELGPVMKGRGTFNQKGPMACSMNVLDAILKTEGTLPVNIKFVLEGEEEMGSIDLPGALEDLREELTGCDYCFFPHFSQDRKGKCIQYLGSKGIVFLKLKLKGGDWGAPTKNDIHGALAVWYDNPVWNMVRILNSLKDENERILVEGFYDDVVGPLPGDEAVLEGLKNYDYKGILETDNVKRFKLGMTPQEAVHRYCYQPEMNICGIAAGYHEDGMKTVLPHEVHVNIDIRTVPNMEPAKVIEQLKRHFEKIGVADMIDVEYLNGYNWFRVGADEPQVTALIDAERELGAQVESWISLNGSNPFSLFQNMFGIPCVFGGLGHGECLHAPDEFITVQGIKDFQNSMVLYLRNLAQA